MAKTSMILFDNNKVAIPDYAQEFFDKRWVEHACVVQNQTTRRGQVTNFRYLLFYLGDKPLTELVRPAEINAFIKAMKKNSQITFKLRNDGKP